MNSNSLYKNNSLLKIEVLAIHLLPVDLSILCSTEEWCCLALRSRWGHPALFHTQKKKSMWIFIFLWLVYEKLVYENFKHCFLQVQLFSQKHLYLLKKKHSATRGIKISFLTKIMLWKKVFQKVFSIWLKTLLTDLFRVNYRVKMQT